MKRLFYQLLLFATISVANAQTPDFIGIKRGKYCSLVGFMNKNGESKYYLIGANRFDLRGLEDALLVSEKLFKNSQLPSITHSKPYLPEIWNGEMPSATTPDEQTVILAPTSSKCISTLNGYHVGDVIDMLKVAEAVDSSLVGCSVACRVLEIRKSNISGSEGRLCVMPLYIKGKNGQKVVLEQSPLFFRGKNRTNAKFWMSFLIVPIFIAGEGVYVDAQELFVATLQK